VAQPPPRRQASAAARELDSRIAAYELAYRMQTAAPEAVDLTRESEQTRKLYGLEDPITGSFAARCLIARRLVERGVRFVQVISGSGDAKDWDHHDDVYEGTLRQARKVDQPIGALLHDLEARGKLDETLVVWTGEFGRTPTS
jgi:membrane-anchored protein YejM (alkaline phosphatase superfamily)